MNDFLHLEKYQLNFYTLQTPDLPTWTRYHIYTIHLLMDILVVISDGVIHLSCQKASHKKK